MIRHYYKDIKVAGTDETAKVKFSADMGEIFYMGDEKGKYESDDFDEKDWDRAWDEVEEEDCIWRQTHKDDWF